LRLDARQTGAVVAACKDKDHLLVSGSCVADPGWLGRLSQAGAVDVGNRNRAASWRCEYFNISDRSELSIQANVHCVGD
jgi:hypothetical protein